MTLLESCENIFGYICRLNRSARKGVSPDMSQARAEVVGLLAEAKARVQALPEGAAEWEKVEPALLYFVDFMVRESRLSFAKDWKELAAEKGLNSGEEEFFDRLDESLRDTSEAGTERLAVYYTCLGLGFTGWYRGNTEYLRKKMLEISARVRGRMDTDRAAKICPESYENVNTSDLAQPPGQKLVGIGIALVGLAATLFAANVVLYLQKRGEMRESLSALTSREVASDKVNGGGK